MTVRNEVDALGRWLLWWFETSVVTLHGLCGFLSVCLTDILTSLSCCINYIINTVRPLWLQHIILKPVCLVSHTCWDRNDTHMNQFNPKPQSLCLMCHGEICQMEQSQVCLVQLQRYISSRTVSSVPELHAAAYWPHTRLPHRIKSFFTNQSLIKAECNRLTRSRWQ